MESKPTKQAVTLALDSLAMHGRFTVRDVAEQAYVNGARIDRLSEADRRDMMIEFLSREAKAQMKTPLRDELKQEAIGKLPEEFWPVLEKLSKTICVSNGAQAYHVFTLYATNEDWDAYLDMADIMAKRVKTARNSGRNIRDLLKTRDANCLFDLMNGAMK